MKIAEKLYTQGLISYPRTETNIFPKELNLANLVEIQCNDPNWGGFAQNILNTTGPTPRNGSKTDQAHPPIHPTKYTNGLEGNERKIYEFIVRQFLACCSADARGFETTVYIEVSQEKFSASGLMITERNYLEVYPYEKWSDKEIPVFEQGQTFTPKSIQMKQGRTEAAKLLTEADLIALMEKHGIGTDATHAEHIETIKERRYVVLDNQNHFIPAELGLGLVEGYDAMGYQMAKPNLRAALESDLKAICDGRKTKDEVLLAQINAYRVCFEDARRNVEKLDDAMAKYFGRPIAGIVEEIPAAPTVVFDCSCKAGIVLRQKKDGNGFYLSCRSYPDCKNSVWFPSSVKQATVLDEYCPNCMPRKVRKINFKLEKGSVSPAIPLDYSTCILCDDHFKECLGIDTRQVKTNPTTQQTQHSTTINSTANYSPPTVTISSMNRTVLPQHQPTRPQVQYRNNSNSAPTQNRSPRGGGAADVDDSNPVVCNCGRAAVLLTVRKEGPNQGRQFYKCEQRENACDFFLWHDSAAAAAAPPSNSMGSFSASSSNYSNVSRNNYSNSSPRTNFSARSTNRDFGGGGASDGLVKCDCNADALLLTTNKPGANQGRKFYKCKESVCKFFKWEDEANGGSGASTTSYQSHGSSGIGTSISDESTASKKRKCGVCGNEGHNRKNCPQIH